MAHLKYYELSDFLQEKFGTAEVPCGFTLSTAEDEKSHTNESFSEALNWSETNSQSKPVWNNIKDEFISTMAEKNLNMDNLMKRKAEYKKLGFNEQLDMMYHNFDGWKAKIKEIKDKYPRE